MLVLTDEILAHLAGGGTLLVPSAQRAAAVRLAYAGAQLACGRRIWDSPDVLPWSAWLERGLDEARMRGESAPRRLAAPEDHALWREAVRAGCADLPVLAPDALIDSVRRATLLLEDYGIDLRDAPTPECALLLRARAAFAERCAQRRLLWSASWRSCAPYLAPRPSVRLAGFADLAPARRAWLLLQGIDPTDLGSAGGSAQRRPAAVQVCACEHAGQEPQAAAQWSAEVLARDPRARLLLVVPRLDEQRHRWVRALTERLDCAALLDPTPALAGGNEVAVRPAARSLIAIEGGQPLAHYPLVELALRLCALAVGRAPFADVSAVLRSGYLAAAGRSARLRLELWLREHRVERLPPPSRLHALAAAAEAALGAAAAAELQTLGEPLVPDAAAGPAGARLWAQRFAQRLVRSGWPGEGLGSREQQVRERFERLLGEFASLPPDTHALEAAAALESLRTFAQRTAFEPASEDAPVTLSASLEHPIVRYDGIWVAGLTAERWPHPMHADPLIPWSAQLAAGLPETNPDGALRRAEQALCAWRHSAAILVLSYARSEEERLCDPSPLLEETEAAAQATAPDAAPAAAPAKAPAEAPPPAGSGFELAAWLAAQAPPLEVWRDAQAPAWPREGALRGGVRLLEHQAECPFRACALWRLGAARLETPAPGIDPRARGELLHRALQLFWSELGGSEGLRGRGLEGAATLALRCLERAAATLQRDAAFVPEPALMRAEISRGARVLERLMQWELARAPFEIEALEQVYPLRYGAAELTLRLDRIDRLADRGRLIIDYKSGKADTFKPVAERLQQPQLPAYATACANRLAAVAALHLAPDGVDLRGLADRDDRLPGLPGANGETDAWQRQLDHWRESLGQLLGEFLRGRADVDPQPGTCKRCHLQLLCRVDAAHFASA